MTACIFLPSPTSLCVFEITLSRANTVDSLATETLLGSLGIESAFILEIAGDERGKHFLIRAEKNQIQYIKAQLQSTYDQITFREITPDQDPTSASLTKYL